MRSISSARMGQSDAELTAASQRRAVLALVIGLLGILIVRVASYGWYGWFI